MTKLNWNYALYAAALVVAVSVPAGAKAELVKQQTVVKEAAIVPETTEETEVEIEVERKVKTKPKKVVKVVREETEITPAVVETQLPAEALTPPPASKPSMGSQLDEGIKTKMVDVQNQFEQALLKTLDRIKITVDDGTAAQGASAPTQNVIVQDNLMGNNAAIEKGDYMSVDAAPVVAEDEEEGEEISAGASTATLDKKSDRKVKIAPLFGRTSIGSNAYNISPRYTAGFELEFDVDASFAMVLGYSYSQYDIALATGNPFTSYYQPYGYNMSQQQSLEYNQNVFSGGMRVYLMPATSKFRMFGGAGVGYNVGYLNYRQNQQQNPFGYQYYNQYYGSTGGDYEVKSWLGLLEAGALMNISESVSLGALFKYALVFSSSENQPLNNYAFNPGFGYAQPNDKAMVGGSLARDNFYSILGTVKVAF